MHLHRRIRAAGPPGPERQRGATLVLVAGFLVALVLTMALAIEVGRLYAAQQNVHRAANLAAIETARYVGGCRALPDGATLQSVAQQSVARNYANRGDGDVPTVSALQTGVTDTTGAGRQVLTDTPQSARPSGVALTVTDASYDSLFPAFTGIGGARIASAAASNKPEATIGIGSALLGIDPVVLNDLLGISVGAAQQGDLANVGVSIGDLVDVSVGAVTRQQVLDTSITEALDNLSDVVNNSTAGLIQELAGLFGPGTSLHEILEIAGPVGRDLSVNAGALVNAAAQLAAIDRDAAIDIPLQLNLPLIGGVEARVRLLEPMQITAGAPGIDPAGQAQGGFPPYYTQVESAQVGLELLVDLASINLGVASANLADLPLVVRGGRAVGGIEAIDCADGSQGFHLVSLDTQADGLRIGTGHLTDIDGDGRREFVPSDATILDISILLVINASVTVSADSRIGLASQDVDFPVHDPVADIPQSTPISNEVDTAYVLDALSRVDLDPAVNGLPIPVDAILNPIRAMLRGPLTALLSPILDPILEQLGVSLGTGEAQLLDLSVDRPHVFCSERGGGCMR